MGVLKELHTGFFSLKRVLEHFRKNQKNSALSDLFSGKSGEKSPRGVDSYPPGKVELNIFDMITEKRT